jgi:hypothetical protein
MTNTRRFLRTTLHFAHCRLTEAETFIASPRVRLVEARWTEPRLKNPIQRGKDLRAFVRYRDRVFEVSG